MLAFSITNNLNNIKKSLRWKKYKVKKEIYKKKKSISSTTSKNIIWL